MGIQIKKDGIYVDGELKVPADKELIISDVYNKMKEDGLKTINGESLLGSGNIQIESKLLQVKFIQSPNERYFFNTSNYVELPGLNTTIKPKSDSSYFLVFATINTTVNYVHSVALKFRDEFVGYPLSNNTNHPNSVYTKYVGTNQSGYIEPKHLMFAVENKSLDDAYIGIWYRDYWNRAYSFYYNDRNLNDMRSLSHMIIMEVKK